MDNQELMDTQAQIDQLQQKLHDEVESSNVAFDLKKNSIFESRNNAIISLITSKDLPEAFWATTLVTLLKLRANTEETFPHFMGPYDEELLTKYLKDIKVSYTEKGHRISLFFLANPYFKETELWAEVLDVMTPGSSDMLHSDAEEEEEEWEEKINFSGITWNPGHGPEGDDEKSQDSEHEEVEPKCATENATHKKRTHENPTVDNPPSGNNHSGEKQGPSVLEVFSLMPPSPEEDSELCSEDDDEDALIEAVNEWEDEMEDRKLLLSTMTEAYYNPIAIWTKIENFKDLEMELKKVKNE
ncbi:unnamed protein product [Phytomonas sp. Hart1]|nr:unnamed protein product [Phytomonas sp. Hart1]|eukprot:CCW66388.1 unnamed protein product [Phytomonas sp. isolate Hart1]